MNKIIWKLLLASPAIIGLSPVFAASSAIAREATATPEASQLSKAQPSEPQILAASVAEPVAEPVAAPVAAAPAGGETLAANSTSAIEQPISAATATEAIEATAAASTTSLATPDVKEDAKELAATAPASSVELPAPAATTSQSEPVATTAPSPQVSDLALQASQNPAPQTTELPAAVPTNRVEVAQTVPNGMGGPIVPAAPQAEPTQQSGAMSQVTSVSQLSDVRPTDWAFQALQSLVERYGCIAGYPDGTFRGNRALTRYEFAAGVNACLDQSK